MKTVTDRSESELKTKGSAFLAYLHPAVNAAAAEKILAGIRTDHPAASHHCHAFIVNPFHPQEYASDDGEPSGTAGFPILNTAKSYDLMNFCLTVVRYYGGTKLGKAGLIEAYGKAAQFAIEAASLYELVPVIIFELNYEYSAQSRIDQLQHRWKWTELNAEYLDTVSLRIGIPEDSADRFRQSISAFSHHLNRIEEKGTSAIAHK